MRRVDCSRVPRSSMAREGSCCTGRIMRAALVKRYTPGYTPPATCGRNATSRSAGTLFSMPCHTSF